MGALSLGDRVVVLRLPDAPSDYVGLVGTVRTDEPDEFGRYGVALDDKPRAKTRWYHWFHPTRLALQTGSTDK